MNQDEFFQANQVDGKLTDEQMVQMLDLPEGDTAQADSSVPNTDQADGTTNNEEVLETKVEKVEVTPVVLAKDGVHTIPFAKLEEARQGEQHWRSVAEEQQRVIDELAKQPAKTEVPAAVADVDAGFDVAKREQDYIDALMNGETDDAKAIRMEIDAVKERRYEAKLNAVLEPIQKQREVSATDAHFKAIADKHPDFESIAQSQELAQWIAKQPSFVRNGYEQVIAQGTAEQAIELFDAFKAANGLTNAAPGRPNVAEIAKTAIANAKSKTPTSLSEIPAGAGVQHDEAAAMLEMSGTSLMAKFEGKTPEQINALLSRII